LLFFRSFQVWIFEFLLLQDELSCLHIVFKTSLCELLIGICVSSALHDGFYCQRFGYGISSCDHRKSISIAGRKERTLSSAKNDLKAELVGLMDELADYVTTTSNGDNTMLLSSGFDITGDKDLSQALPPIERLLVVSDQPGQVICTSVHNRPAFT
jgi:hypothetical protein